MYEVRLGERPEPAEGVEISRSFILLLCAAEKKKNVCTKFGNLKTKIK